MAPVRWKGMWLAIGWLLLVAIVYLSVAPLAAAPPLPGGDKFGHVIAYAAAMFWFAQIYEDARTRMWIAAALVALGVGLEFVQAMTAYRSFEYGDMVADALGVAIGWFVSPPRIMNFLARIEAAV